MALVGYARVSTTDQSLDIQLTQLKEAGCTRVFAEQRTGTNLDRPEWVACLQYLRDGDTLLVTRLDRLARSISDLYKIIEALNAKSVSFKVLLQPEIDTTTANGRLVMAVMAAMAEFETEVRKARQREGIEAAKAKGVYRGQKKVRAAKKSAARRLLNNGVGPFEVSIRTGIPVRTIYSWFPGAATKVTAVAERKARFTQKLAGSPAPALPAQPSAAEAVEPQATPETPARKAGLMGRLFRG